MHVRLSRSTDLHAVFTCRFCPSRRTRHAIINHLPTTSDSLVGVLNILESVFVYLSPRHYPRFPVFLCPPPRYVFGSLELLLLRLLAL